MALLDEKNLAAEAAKRARFRVHHVGTKLNEAQLHELEVLAAKRKQTQAELIRGLVLREIEQDQTGLRPSADGGDHGVPAAVGEPAWSAGKRPGDDVRGVRRNRRLGQEAEGACGSGPAQRPRSAVPRIDGLPSRAAAGGLKGKCSGGKSAATEALPFLLWQVYGAREASQGSALRSDRNTAQRTRP